MNDHKVVPIVALAKPTLYSARLDFFDTVCLLLRCRGHSEIYISSIIIEMRSLIVTCGQHDPRPDR